MKIAETPPDPAVARWRSASAALLRPARRAAARTAAARRAGARHRAVAVFAARVA